MQIWLAPLHGITLSRFRNVLIEHVSGIDAAITPFLPIQESTKLNVKKWKDILPENNNRSLKLIPQLIGNNPSHFLDTVLALSDFGYTSFNWNIGCPMPSITRKKRGCGLMPYPDVVEEVMDLIISKTNFSFSLKMRLGLNQMSESKEIIKRMNQYPLDFIVIHPRLGIWQYNESPDLITFEERVKESKNEIIYSGDIINTASFHFLQQKFPNIRQWMIGRGVLQNPFLAEMIKGNNINGELQYKKRFINFYDSLINSLLEERNEKGVLANLKELWHYFAVFFHLTSTDLKILLRINEFSEFKEKTLAIITK